VPFGPAESRSRAACLARCCVPVHCAAWCSQSPWNIMNELRNVSQDGPWACRVSSEGSKECRPPKLNCPTTTRAGVILPYRDQGPRICASSGWISRARQKKPILLSLAANGTKISGCSAVPPQRDLSTPHLHAFLSDIFRLPV
jgi:hypothetical protein